MQAQLFLTACIATTTFVYLHSATEIKAGKGNVWPKPVWQDDTGLYIQVDPNDFALVVTNKNCDLLQQAISRYTNIIKESAKGYIRADVTPVVKTIKQLEVELTTPCEALPYHGMDESYYVHGHGQVVANSIWGILRGLETLSQLLVPMSNGMLRIPETEIYDEPRFKYRGLMLMDTKHFKPMPKIFELIDAMAYNKLNVFHWHMAEYSDLPYKSTTFSKLSAREDCDSRATFSPGDVADIIEYARLRGIRVIPEFDTPAHMASWGAYHAEIMAQCFGAPRPLDPMKHSTYSLLHSLFSEIKTLFPDKYVHIGGDEAGSYCSENNPGIEQFLPQHGQGNGALPLPRTFLEQFAANITKLDLTPIVWQEAILEHSGVVHLPPGTIAQVWYDYKSAMASLTNSGYTTIMSDGFNLYGSDDGADWIQFYEIEPTNFSGTMVQKNRVAGGEVCLWSEWANDDSIISMAFPRASAVAERLWSEQAHRNIDEAQSRLEEHNCRMLWRGIEHGFC